MSKKRELVARDIELLEALLIVNLVQAGVPQNTVKKIVRVSTNRVNAIAKHLPQGRRKNEN